MASPNIVNVTSIYGNSINVSLSTTSATQLASNAASSGKAYKINSIIVANTNEYADKKSVGACRYLLLEVTVPVTFLRRSGSCTEL